MVHAAVLKQLMYVLPVLLGAMQTSTGCIPARNALLDDMQLELVLRQQLNVKFVPKDSTKVLLTTYACNVKQERSWLTMPRTLPITTKSLIA
jgi:hypothetical protein